jgi:beta-glucuronidase
MGHLPFEAEITSCVIFGRKNRVTLSVDNILLQNSVPQGRIENIPSDNGTIRTQTYTFDFFNYAGIHRYVSLQH